MCCLLLHQETTSTQVHIQLLSLCSSSQIYSGYLTRSSFTHNIYGPCQSLICGFDSMQYVSHSFRIRAATTAETVGLPNCLIKVLHQWKSNVYHTCKDGRVEKTDPHSADYPLTPLRGLLYGLLRGLLYGLVRGLPCGLP